MSFLLETNEELALGVDCYWEAALPPGETTIRFPSLPEPYLNLFIPLNSTTPSSLKGISESASFFDMSSSLFGVRLNVQGFYSLRLGNPSTVTNRVLPFSSLGPDESQLELAIRDANTFEMRIELFRNYFEEKLKKPVSAPKLRVCDAFDFLVSNYANPNVVEKYAQLKQVSPRTVSRWFTSSIGIAPKRVARIARFHKALSGFHSASGPRFFLDCGYFDQAHFIREFKEFTSLTPSSYSTMISNIRF